MFNINDKKKLYWLLDQYLLGKINERTFCDEFYYSYDLEIKHKDFTKEEVDIFSDLSLVLSRFSEFEEDHLLSSKAFSTKEELMKKVKESKNKLAKILC